MEAPVIPFDLQRLLFGDPPMLFLLEIVLRVVVIYLFALFVMQLMGKRGQRQLSPLELLIIISLGSATGDSMFYPDVPLTHAFVVIFLVVFISEGLAWLEGRNDFIRNLFESDPTWVVDEGRVLEQNLRRERVSKTELYSMLREAGVENLGQVRAALLELSGNVSVFTYPEGEEKPGESILPPKAHVT